ncbi:ABC transporter permease [Anaerobium acetethylicum]|uniref:Putative ABC transport system permease protein n=1 Tax=Anaerobium acetethylicum TaxID=1619234 RepID=A0A1D3TVT6_9FIRM|nr:ABC transporter permease [Anaerobium acetethylicum]SCP98267.1 putative ABC transport system permease protein [Anaerobium acetethylicum]
MNGIITLNLWQFALIYLLLLVVLAIMKKCRIDQTRLLIVASFRMTVQLVLAGLILTAIFKNPHPAFTLLYLVVMTGFAIYMVLSKNKGINRRFKAVVAVSLAVTGLSIVVFFIVAVVGADIFNPRYTIPVSGMIIGNAMNGVSLGLRNFNENIRTQRNKIDTLINIGVTPQKILEPFVNQSLETAMLPTLNSMLGMGIISLPGMMTGQILSGTMPMTAILYQIAILIAICTVTCLAVFCSLHFGYRTLYNKRNQMVI